MIEPDAARFFGGGLQDEAFQFFGGDDDDQMVRRIRRFCHAFPHAWCFG